MRMTTGNSPSLFNRIHMLQYVSYSVRFTCGSENQSLHNQFYISCILYDLHDLVLMFL